MQKSLKNFEMDKLRFVIAVKISKQHRNGQQLGGSSVASSHCCTIYYLFTISYSDLFLLT